MSTFLYLAILTCGTLMSLILANWPTHLALHGWRKWTFNSLAIFGVLLLYGFVISLFV